MDEQENRAQDTNTQVDKVELGDNSQKLEAKSKDSSGLGRPKIGDSRPAPNTPETGAQGKKKRKRRRSRSGNSRSENLANVSVELASSDQPLATSYEHPVQPALPKLNAFAPINW